MFNWFHWRILVAQWQLVDMLFELFSVDVASTLSNIFYDV
jgi:hypothetical protein